jgi:plasmid maintenance system antidote protein VapI
MKTLKDFLKENHMTQKELNLRTLISEKHISNIVKSKVNISEKISIKLHYVFNTEMFYFSRLNKKLG